MRKNRKLTITKFMDSMNKIYKTTEYKDIIEPFDKSKSFTDKYSCVNNGVFAAAMKKIILANGGTEPTNVPLYKDNDALSSEVFDFYIEEYAKIKGYVAPIDPSDDEEDASNYIFELIILEGGEGFGLGGEKSGKPINDLVAGMTADIYMNIPDEMIGQGEEALISIFEDNLGWSNVTIEGTVAKGTLTSTVCDMNGGVDKWFDGEETDGVYEIEIHNGDVAFKMDGDYKMVIAVNKGTANTGDWVMYMRS